MAAVSILNPFCFKTFYPDGEPITEWDGETFNELRQPANPNYLNELNGYPVYGGGTGHPVGFTLDELFLLFYRVKYLKLSHSLSVKSTRVQEGETIETITTSDNILTTSIFADAVDFSSDIEINITENLLGKNEKALVCSTNKSARMFIELFASSFAFDLESEGAVASSSFSSTGEGPNVVFCAVGFGLGSSLIIKPENENLYYPSLGYFVESLGFSTSQRFDPEGNYGSDYPPDTEIQLSPVSFILPSRTAQFPNWVYGLSGVEQSEVKIEIAKYWPYDPEDGGGPIYDSETGAQLRSF
jgi:hypothetical protein